MWILTHDQDPCRLPYAAAIAIALTAWVTAQSVNQPAGSSPAFPVHIQVDASKVTAPLKQIWRFFGADEPNYAYMKDGQKLIADMGRLAPNHVYFRAHSLLVTGDGTPALKWGSTNAYREDAQGNPIYDWAIVDRIFDTYLQRNVKPYVEIGFMPEALSTKPQPYKHSWTPLAKYEEIYTGWAYPPTDYKKWGDLIYAWARHCVEKYGRAEVEQWYWETWNEANIGYWRGTPEEFRKLHDYTVDAVRRALPTARVGGPDTAGTGGQFTRDFFEHQLRGTNYATGKTGTPIDFVSFHAKGRPEFVDGHVRLGIANQLATIDGGFQIVASFPELKSKPIVIGESDPDGCAACQGPQLGYRNTHDVFELYGRSLRAEARPRRAPRREPRGGAHLGLRVRGPAVFRRLPGAGVERHQPSRVQRVSDVQPDGRAARRRDERRRRRPRRHDEDRRAGQARRGGAREPRREPIDAPRLALSRR